MNEYIDEQIEELRAEIAELKYLHNKEIRELEHELNNVKQALYLMEDLKCTK